MLKFVVGHIDWFDHELRLERIDAPDWRIAVTKHSKFPWTENDYNVESEEAFKASCFDCDCMMSWIEA